MTHVDELRAGPGSPRAPLGGGIPRASSRVRWGAATTGAADEAGPPPAAPVVADATLVGSPHDDVVAGTRRHRVRVHLEENWPAGELLGVVTWQGPDVRQPRKLRDGHPLQGLVTRVTTTPRLRRDGPSPFLRMSAFAARTLVHTGLTPPGIDPFPGTTVNVAGHEVGFDLRPGLSFADVDIDVPDGTESVRLALVRLDPEAGLAQRVSPVAVVEVALGAAAARDDQERLEA